MKHTFLTVLGILALLLGSCIPSLNPLYQTPEKDTRLVPELLGAWEMLDDQGKVLAKIDMSKGKNGSHKMMVTEGEWVSEYEAYVVPIEGHLFLDTHLVEAPKQLRESMFLFHVIPAHMFWHLEQDEGQWSLNCWIGMNAVEDMGKRPKPLKMQTLSPNNPMHACVSSSSDLKKFFRKAITDSSPEYPLFKADVKIFLRRPKTAEG
ncbi:MAG: hypothetical protein DWQ01_05495 [Planctomycetota bacterium]|nr:MAG: hypothetical protein DWQ01_05495 [Planctomycetota bacterium]